MGLILYPDGTQKEVQPRNGSSYQLDELQAIVDGHIEIIPTKDDRILVCNEEAKLLDLPRNDQATALVDFPSPREMLETLRKHPEIIFVGEVNDTEVDFISGTCLLCENTEVQ